jgi:hypothetical protein
MHIKKLGDHGYQAALVGAIHQQNGGVGQKNPLASLKYC